jgi:hypothetical protein
MRLFTRHGRALLLAATVIGAAWLPWRGENNGAFAGEYFYPTQKGSAHVTALKDCNGNTVKYIRETITDVMGTADNRTIICRTEIFDEQYRPDKNIPVSESIIRLVDDTLLTDTRTALKPILDAAGFSAVNWAFSGDTLISIPSKIKPGDRLKDEVLTITGRVNNNTMTITTSTTNRMCLAIENITVPAGTFKACKLTETMTFTVTFPTEKTVQELTTVTWAALGVGTVKAVVTDENGDVQSVAELQKIIK